MATTWKKGTSNALLAELNTAATDATKRSRSWLDAAAVEAVECPAPTGPLDLRRAGVDTEFPDYKNRTWQGAHAPNRFPV